MKIRNINLPWNQITGRIRRALVLPRRDRYDNGIPTIVLPMKVELIEEYQVLKKFVLNGMWCFIIVRDNYYGHEISVISFDDDGNEFEVR